MAEQHAKRICQKENIQLLDGTVALQKLGFQRQAGLKFELIRYFKFEFSLSGLERHLGVIALNRYHRQVYTFLDLPEKPTIDIEKQNSSSED